MRLILVPLVTAVLALAAGCSSDAPPANEEQVSETPSTESASPIELPAPSTLEELEEQLQGEFQQQEILVAFHPQNDDTINLSISANDVETVLTTLATARDAMSELPDGGPTVGYSSLRVTDPAGGDAYVSILASVDDDDIATALDAALQSPCGEYTIDPERDGEPHSSAITCHGAEESATDFVATIPERIEHSPIDEAIMGEVTWRMSAHWEEFRANANVDTAWLEAERQAVLTDVAELLDEAGATKIDFSLFADRFEVQADIEQSQQAIGEELMALVRPLGLEDTSVLLWDVDDESQQGPLVHLKE